jgi:hypothetical protein
MVGLATRRIKAERQISTRTCLVGSTRLTLMKTWAKVDGEMEELPVGLQMSWLPTPRLGCQVQIE